MIMAGIKPNLSSEAAETIATAPPGAIVGLGRIHPNPAMRLRLFVFSASLAFAGLPMFATADTLAVPAADNSTATNTALPHKGELQSQVLKTFGEPQKKHPSVGGESPKHPPITRWDYAGFSVFFENSHVVDTVVPTQPTPLYNTDKLSPAKL
jgi:hypothetical protein